jgi:thiol-disulfide isomerase/thioredoxin
MTASGMKSNLLKFGILVIIAFLALEVRSQNIQAPSLEINKWIKGDAITAFKQGQIYLVDFGGTWCHSCRKALPHLSSLANKYKDKAVVIAVFCEMDSTGPKVVESFIAKLRYPVNFAVAVDGGTKDKWDSAGAKLYSFPTAFIVNGKGTIVWSGDPLDADEVIAYMLSENDSVTGIELIKTRQSLFQATLTKVEEDIQDKKYEALHTLDSLISRNPQKLALYAVKLDALMEFSPDKTAIFLNELLQKKMTGFDWTEVAIRMYRLLTNNPSISNYELSLRIFDKTIQESEVDWVAARVLSERAGVHRLMKNYTKAIADLEQAITLGQLNSGYHPIVLEDYKKQLEELKAL